MQVSAASWNSLMDLLDRSEVEQKGGGGADSSPAGSRQVYHVKNSSDALAPRFGVLGIDGPIITEAASVDEYEARATFNGVEPLLADHTSRFAIMAEPVPAGEVGKCFVSGVCLAAVAIVAEGDRRAGITDAEPSKLTSGRGPVEILYAPAGTGDKVCIVRLGASEGPILAKITGVDVGNAEFSLTEVFPDGEARLSPRVWDGGSSPNYAKAFNLHGVPVGAVDSIVQLHRGEVSADSASDYWWFEGLNPWAAFPVGLTEDGGGAGDKATECDFTYTVDDLDGNELGTAVDPEHARPSLGKMVAATKGTAYYTADATLTLLWTDEQPDTAAC